MKKVVLAYSGGLDTTYCAVYLKEQGDKEIHAITVQTGGFSEEELKDIEQRAYSLGVTSWRVADVTGQYYKECIRYLIYGNVLKNDTYPLSVSAERMVQAISVAEFAKEMAADAVAHGSTGAGNDQVRFDMVFQSMLPAIEIITPIRDQKLSRAAEIEFLKNHGVSMNFEKAAYSINKGLWGTSVGGIETLNSKEYLPDSAWPTPATETESKDITLHFEQGELKGFDGKIPTRAVEIIC